LWLSFRDALEMGKITELIEQGHAANGVDGAALFEAAYSELKKLAHARLSRNGPMTLLDSTVLVNEIWLRLSDKQTLQVDSRRRFFAYAAQVMRTIIVDHIRERAALRRGGGERLITLNTAIGDGLADNDEALQIHEALESLAQLEPRLAQVVEMRYFGGMTEVEIGEALGLTERTVRRDWEKARLLLASMLE
jgi:RNA polymerase sigma factor (TIGR02999 family)